MNSDGTADPVFDAEGGIAGSTPGDGGVEDLFGDDEVEPLSDDDEPADRMGGGSGRGARPAGRTADGTDHRLDEDSP
jgi:hypothetical protein